MKKGIHASWYIVIPIVCFMIYGYFVANKKPYISPVSYIVKDGQLTQPMKDLLKLSYIEYDGSFQDAVRATQNHWLRPSGSKRWEMDNTTYANRKEIWDSFEKLHLVQRIEPVYNQSLIFKSTLYTFMIVTGGVYDLMKAKMQYIQNLCERKVSCWFIIFLGTDRKLDPIYEIESMAHDFVISEQECPQTESEMIKFMADKMIPAGLTYYGDRAYITVQGSKENSLSNINTCDALQTWLKNECYVDSSKADCLVISAQPYIAYEHSVFTTHMPKDFSIETVGPATIEFMHTGVYFDTLTRILYQENIHGNMKQ